MHACAAHIRKRMCTRTCLLRAHVRARAHVWVRACACVRGRVRVVPARVRVRAMCDVRCAMCDVHAMCISGCLYCHFARPFHAHTYPRTHFNPPFLAGMLAHALTSLTDYTHTSRGHARTPPTYFTHALPSTHTSTHAAQAPNHPFRMCTHAHMHTRTCTDACRSPGNVHLELSAKPRRTLGEWRIRKVNRTDTFHFLLSNSI